MEAILQQSSTVFVSFYVAISLPTSLSDIFGKKSFDLQARRQAPITSLLYDIWEFPTLPPPPPSLHGLARGEGKLRRRETKDDFWKDFWETGCYLSVLDSMVIFLGTFVRKMSMHSLSLQVITDATSLFPNLQSIDVNRWYAIFMKSQEMQELIRYLHISHNTPSFAPQIVLKHCLLFMGTTIIHRRHQKQRLSSRLSKVLWDNGSCANCD